MSKRSFWRMSIVACALTLGGCGGLLPRPQTNRVVMHDFGPAPRYHALVSSPVTAWVTSVPWLAGTQIDYRLLYEDPTAVHSYADNRWLAPPAQLLEARLHARLGGIAPLASGARMRLVVTILRFGQDFSSPDHALAHIELEARLMSLTSNAVIARHITDIAVPCAPDAGGAVKGLSRAARRAVDDLAAFVSAQAKDRG